MLGVADLPGLGFHPTGRQTVGRGLNWDVSPRQLSAAIYGFQATRDMFTGDGTALPLCPSLERGVHEGVIAQCGWLRPCPSLATMALKYPSAAREDKDEQQQKGKQKGKGKQPAGMGGDHPAAAAVRVAVRIGGAPAQGDGEDSAPDEAESDDPPRARISIRPGG